MTPSTLLLRAWHEIEPCGYQNPSLLETNITTLPSLIALPKLTQSHLIFASSKARYKLTPYSGRLTGAFDEPIRIRTVALLGLGTLKENALNIPFPDPPAIPLNGVSPGIESESLTLYPASSSIFRIWKVRAVVSAVGSAFAIHTGFWGNGLRKLTKASCCSCVIFLGCNFCSSAMLLERNSSTVNKTEAVFDSAIFACSFDAAAFVSAIPAKILASPASLLNFEDSHSENGRHPTSPAIPKIRRNSNFFFSFSRLHLADVLPTELFGINHFKAQWDSPHSATNTTILNKISNHPQSGIEGINGIGFWVFAILCWTTSLVLIVFGFRRYCKK